MLRAAPFSASVVVGLILSGLLGESPKAYEWLSDGPVRNRSLDIVWEFNPRDCPLETRGMLDKASRLLDFYLLTDFSIRHAGDTGRRDAIDGHNVVGCDRVLNYMQRGYGFRSAGVTLISRTNGLISDADIILNADRLSFKVVLHEFAHMLGLGHSAAPPSIVCHSEIIGHCRSRDRLDADDLVGLASLYGVPANCTPYLSDELEFYFPHIGGFWAELRPLEPGVPDMGYFLAASGQSIDYDWQCSLVHSPGFREVVGEVYHRGEVIETEFLQRDGIWDVNFLVHDEKSSAIMRAVHK